MLSFTFLSITSDEHNVKLVLLTVGKRSKVADYYKKQERLREGFTEMEKMAEAGCMPGSLTEVGCLLQTHTHTHTKM
jgi:hypothetical protein